MRDTLALLRSEDKTATWLTALEAAGSPEVDVVLPSADDMPAVLLDLAVPHTDVNELIALARDLRDDPELWWLLQRCVQRLVRGTGTVGDAFDLPYLPEGLGAVGRYFHAYVFLAALPHVQAYHRERGVPDDVSRRTLADLGRNMALHRRRHGIGGVLQPFWIKLHFRGELYQLGRLQFQRGALGERTGRAIAAAGSLGPGDPILDVHIPDFSGPLTPSACDASFARAREFFPRCFPEETYAVATCHSWLLDPQLGHYLPEHSNIIGFQRRFQLAYQAERDNDTGPVEYVFGDPGLPVSALPRRTTLERAVGDHLRAGRHWYDGHGWLRL